MRANAETDIELEKMPAVVLNRTPHICGSFRRIRGNLPVGRLLRFLRTKEPAIISSSALDSFCFVALIPGM